MAENDHRPDPDDDQPQDPISRMFEQFMGQGGSGAPDPAAMQAMFSQLQGFFGAMASGTGQGPVNWTLAKDTAHRAVQDNAAVTPSQRSDVEQSSQLAQLWLDAATDFPDATGTPRALRRSEWIDASLPRWQDLAEPVAASAAQAVSGSLGTQMPPELAGLMGQAGGMLSSLGGALFGAQLGGAVGSLAGEVLSGTDAGLPLAGPGFALVSQNVDAFIAELDLPRQEVLLYLALREAAHLRLFHGAAWLEGHVLGLVRDFAAGITIDTSAIQDKLQGIDPTDAESLQELMSGGLVAPTTTPAQRAALDRLETVLALIEGWVDAVVTEASTNLPAAPALREMLRRRRATGGPSEQAFAGLIGLELRPRRAREAAALWEHIAKERGQGERDGLWSELGLLPTAEDLDDPAGFFERRALIGASDDDFDAALSAWLDGPKAESSGDAPQAGDEPDAGEPGSENDSGTSNPS